MINKARKNLRGKRINEIRENGGVMIWVRKGLKQKLIHQESQGEARILTVDVQGWRIHGGYEPPKEKLEMAAAISTMRVKMGSPPKGPTLAVGDWNEKPGESVEQAWQHHMGISVVEMKGDDKVTRRLRRGQKGKQIDYFLADKETLNGATVDKLTMKIGDHFVLRLEVPVAKELKAEPERRLKKGACWMNPGYFSTLEWKTILKERWEYHSRKDWWEGNRESVEETWQAFMNMMDRLHREAARRLSV